MTHFTDGLTDDHLFILTDGDAKRRILDINVVTMEPREPDDIAVSPAANRIQLLNDSVLVLLAGNLPVQQYIYTHDK